MILLCQTCMLGVFYVSWNKVFLAFSNILKVGKMVLELGDSCTVRCKTSDLVCELDFKTKVIKKKVNKKH